MPYRIDIADPSDELFDRLVALGAIDVDSEPGAGTAALLPDHVSLREVKAALGRDDVRVSVAVARDLGSVWVLKPRPIQVGSCVLRLTDSEAFGTGLHPTTALCLEVLAEIVETTSPAAVLDVGAGSGVLALAALLRGVPTAVGIDTDDQALRIAAENARLNGLDSRLHLSRGGPEVVTGRFPLVMANILAAPLIEMAPAVLRCIGHHGRLVLSGIPTSAASDVEGAYRRLGMRRLGSTSQGSWTALVLQASW